MIVGFGRLSRAMLEALARKEWYDLAAVVDVRDSVLTEAQRQLSLPGGTVFRSLDEAIAKAGASVAIINTPSEMHYQQAKKALQAGLDVLVAKPMTVTYSHAVELVELARAKGRNLSVGQQLRYFRHYRAVKRLVESGRLGKVEIISLLNGVARRRPLNLEGMGQPVLLELSCHHFDCLMSITSERLPEWIVCDGFQPSWSAYDGPCMVNALMRLSDGAHILYQAGFSSQAGYYELRLEGSNGILRCRGTHITDDTIVSEYAESGGDLSTYQLSEDAPGEESAFSIFLNLWYAYLCGGPEPHFSGRNNLKVLALVDAAIESVRRACPIPVATSTRYAPAFRYGSEWSSHQSQ